MALGIWACAQPGTLTGGPRDETPPEVARTEPASASLNYAGKTVKIVFSEPIRKPTFGKEIFISPLVKRPKIIQSDSGKRIRIEFDEPLRSETTYLITLKEIKDVTESNEIEEAYILAFSTGDVLDSMEIKGRIEAPAFGQAPKDMTVFLFDADSVEGNDFLGIRPAYLTTADEQGNFSFRYLRNAPYKIYGVNDADQSNTYNQPGEVVAMSEDSLFTFPEDSSNLGTVKLFSFLPDDEAPRLQNYGWLSDSILVVRFSENLRLDSTAITISDTLHQDSLEALASYFIQRADAELFLHMPRPRDSVSDVRFAFLSDSLFNHVDTVLRVVSTKEASEEEQPFLQKPELDIVKERWEMPLVRPLRPGEDSLFALTDTARYDSLRINYPLDLESEGFLLAIQTDSAKPEVPFLLRVPGRILDSQDSVMRDSLFPPIKLQWFDPENLGSINGQILYDSTYQGPLVFQLLNGEKKVVREIRDTAFDFTLLPEGNYTARLIFDADSNGVWTPGSLKTGRLPERIYTHSEPLNVKASWDFDDFEIQIDVSGSRAAGASASKEGEAPPEGSPASRKSGSRPGGKGGRG